MTALRLRSRLAILMLSLFAAGVAVGAAEAAPEGSGLPLPRFVSLRADEVNMRIGPGVQYPVEWVYTRQRLPVEVIAEYRTWRKIRDWEGTQGWIHQSMLDGRRTAVVIGSARTLRQEANVKSAAVARVEAGVIVNLLACPKSSTWCKVDADGHVGWLRRVEFWGTQRNEVIE